MLFLCFTVDIVLWALKETVLNKTASDLTAWVSQVIYNDFVIIGLDCFTYVFLYLRVSIKSGSNCFSIAWGKILKQVILLYDKSCFITE